MAWKRKNKSENSESEATSEVAVTSPETSRKKAPNKNELLSSVIRESVMGPVLAVVKENTAFALPGGNAWLVLVLPVSRIGGLSTKDRNDQDKGQLLRLIDGDQIQIIATQDLISEQMLGIIPTSGTLERMGEFSLLEKAGYVWSVLTITDGGRSINLDPVRAGTVAEPRINGSLAEARSIADGKVSAASVLPAVWAAHGGDVQDAVVPEEVTSGLPTQVMAPVAAEPEVEVEPAEDFDYNAADESSEDDFEDDEDVSTGYGASAVDDEDVYVPQADDEVYQGDDSLEDYDEAGVPAGVVDDRVFDESAVRSAVARHFLKGDLDLVVETDSFESMFSTEVPVILFDAPEATDWLGQQVAILQEQANMALAAQHRDHLIALRTTYLELMTVHTSKTIAEVDPANPSSTFHTFMQAARSDYEKARDAAIGQVRDEITELDRRREAEATERAEAAAAAERVRFRDRTQATYEAERAAISGRIDNATEDQFALQQSQVHELRRSQAHNRMELGQTKTAQLLVPVAEEQRAAELSLMREWQERILAFVDANRKDDVARSDALAEQLARSNAVEDLARSHEKQMLDLRAETDARVTQVQGEMSLLLQKTQSSLEEQARTTSSQLSVEQQRTTNAVSLVDEVRKEADASRARLLDEHRAQLQTVKEDAASQVASSERMVAAATKTNKTMVMMMIALCVILAAAGVVVGVLIGQSGGDAAAGMALVNTWLPGMSPLVG